jgi:hypothetical protein
MKVETSQGNATERQDHPPRPAIAYLHHISLNNSGCFIKKNKNCSYHNYKTVLVKHPVYQEKNVVYK